MGSIVMRATVALRRPFFSSSLLLFLSRRLFFMQEAARHGF